MVSVKLPLEQKTVLVAGIPRNWLLLDRCCSEGKQSLDYRALWQTGTHRMRVRRTRDFYDFQSFAIIERWNGEKWHEVERIPYAKMATCKEDWSGNSNASRPLVPELADEAELIRLASLILGGE